MRHFEKLEELLAHINREDSLAAQMEERSAEVSHALEEFVEREFGNLGFVLYFHDHGSIGSVSIDAVKVNDLYALNVVDGCVRGEASVSVSFSADFEYDDFDTASYDKESHEWFFLNTVEGEAQDRADVAVGFTFAIDAKGQAAVSELVFREDTITVKEEDRGDYDAYK